MITPDRYSREWLTAFPVVGAVLGVLLYSGDVEGSLMMGLWGVPVYAAIAACEWWRKR